MGLAVVTPRTWLPLTLAEVTAHLRLDGLGGEDDALLIQYQEAALAELGDETGRSNWAITAQRLAWSFRCWPAGHRLVLPKPPCRAVVSIQYVDPAGVVRTWNPADYSVDLTSQPAVLRPTDRQSWPDLADRLEAVTVTFDAGYGSFSDVPAPIKTALLLTIEQYHPRPDSPEREVLQNRVDELMAHFRDFAF